MKTAFVLCSRLDSMRFPKKAFRLINGLPLIIHLIRRLNECKLPVIVAVPTSEIDQYVGLLEKWGESAYFYSGHDEDPLGRMSAAAEFYGVETVIRVTHDKIFVDPEQVFTMLESYYSGERDYVFSSTLTPGTGFEIIKASVLAEAAAKYKNVEFAGYAVRTVTQNYVNCVFEKPQEDVRLLVDYPEDLTLLELVMSSLGNACSLEEALRFLASNPWAKKINRLPKLTIYTCVLNGGNFIDRCMGSVASQRGFKDFEYVIVDDHSNDRTTERIAKFCTLYPNARWMRNSENLGLASSSNVALKAARGEYIMRLDADDYFANADSAKSILDEIVHTQDDAVYPNFFVGNTTKVGWGREHHHIGGAIFSTRAINHVKFTDHLRGYDGLDLFLRAKEQLKIGYFNRPNFFYSQRQDSMSKTNLKEREAILSALTGGPLITTEDLDDLSSDLGMTEGVAPV